LTLPAFANAVEIQRQVLETGPQRIKPGITTPEEICWWAADAWIAPWRSDRAHIMIQPTHIFAFEFNINTWVPEWGRRASINFKDNAIVTHNGVEYLAPINEEIILIC